MLCRQIIPFLCYEFKEMIAKGTDLNQQPQLYHSQIGIPLFSKLVYKQCEIEK